MTAAEPSDRPFKRREATRLVVLSGTDADRSVLLFEDSDPGLDQYRWWVTPGGGIDPGETVVQAGLRELQEETGWRAGAADLIGPLSVRRTIHGYSDQILVQRETFFAIHTPRFELDTSGHTEDEKITLKSWRWWPLAELGPAARSPWIWPTYLMELVDLADAVGAGGGRTPGSPRDYGDQVDESTLPLSAAELELARRS